MGSDLGPLCRFRQGGPTPPEAATIGRPTRSDALAHRGVPLPARRGGGGAGEPRLHALQPTHGRTRGPTAAGRRRRSCPGLVVAPGRLGRARRLRAGHHAARRGSRVRRLRRVLLDPGVSLKPPETCKVELRWFLVSAQPSPDKMQLRGKSHIYSVTFATENLPESGIIAACMSHKAPIATPGYHPSQRSVAL